MNSKLLVEVLGTIKPGYIVEEAEVVVGIIIDNGQLIIGSKPEIPPCLVISNTSVSRKHAILQKKGHDWSIADLGSDNGILIFEVDGSVSRLESRKEMIVLGETRLVLGEILIRLTLRQ